MKNAITFLITGTMAAAIGNGATAQNVEFTDLLAFGGPGVDQARDMAIDSQNKIVLTGVYGGFGESAQFGGGTVFQATANEWEEFVAKYDENFNLLWLQHAGGSGAGSNYGFRVSLDENDNIFVSGTYAGSVTFDNPFFPDGAQDTSPPTNSITLPNRGPNDDAFLMKLDDNGHVLWAKSGYGTLNTNSPKGLAFDGVGNVYVAGSYVGSFTLDGFSTIPTFGERDIFLAKYSENGDPMWITHFGSNGTDILGDIVVDSNGFVMIAGRISGTASFDNFTITSAGGFDNYLAKIDPSGNVVWVERAGGPGWESMEEIESDGAGGTFVSGSFEGTAEFGTTTHTSVGDSDAYVARYDANGSLIWLTQMGGPLTGGDAFKNEVAFGLSHDADHDRLVTAGLFEGAADFGGDTLASADDTLDIFVAELAASNGAINWAVRAGSDVSGVFETAFDVEHINSDIVVGGQFQGDADFGPFSATSDGDFDMFLARLRPAPDVAPNPSRNDAYAALVAAGVITEDDVLFSAQDDDIIATGGVTSNNDGDDFITASEFNDTFKFDSRDGNNDEGAHVDIIVGFTLGDVLDFRIDGGFFDDFIFRNGGANKALVAYLDLPHLASYLNDPTRPADDKSTAFYNADTNSTVYIIDDSPGADGDELTFVLWNVGDVVSAPPPVAFPMLIDPPTSAADAQLALVLSGVVNAFDVLPSSADDVVDVTTNTQANSKGDDLFRLQTVSATITFDSRHAGGDEGFGVDIIAGLAAGDALSFRIDGGFFAGAPLNTNGNNKATVDFAQLPDLAGFLNDPARDADDQSSATYYEEANSTVFVIDDSPGSPGDELMIVAWNEGDLTQ